MSLSLFHRSNPFKVVYVRGRATFTTVGSEDEQADARRWLASFNRSSLHTKDADVTFSRSSGPGGQNVNKSVDS